MLVYFCCLFPQTIYSLNDFNKTFPSASFNSLGARPKKPAAAKQPQSQQPLEHFPSLGGKQQHPPQPAPSDHFPSLGGKGKQKASVSGLNLKLLI